MKFEIKHRLTGAVRFSAETGSLKLCVQLAIKSKADLQGVYLRGAYLQGADLQGVYLQGAYLQGAKNTELAIARTSIVPQEGAFVGWKKLKGDVIARLVIPHDAQRVNCSGSRKCRASKVFVHEIFGAAQAFDKHTGKLLYVQGQEVSPDGFNDSVTEECAQGIHFFMTREEAEDY